MLAYRGEVVGRAARLPTAASRQHWSLRLDPLSGRRDACPTPWIVISSSSSPDAAALKSRPIHQEALLALCPHLARVVLVV